MSERVTITCYRCKTTFAIPRAHYDAAKASDKIEFFCSYGHGQVFREGPTEEDKLRQERDRLKQRTAELEDDAQMARDRAHRAELRASAARGQVTRLKNRAAAGVCPCCNRTFVNLQRHMASKHVGFAKVDDISAVETIQ